MVRILQSDTFKRASVATKKFLTRLAYYIFPNLRSDAVADGSEGLLGAEDIPSRFGSGASNLGAYPMSVYLPARMYGWRQGRTDV